MSEEQAPAAPVPAEQPRPEADESYESRRASIKDRMRALRATLETKTRGLEATSTEPEEVTADAGEQSAEGDEAAEAEASAEGAGEAAAVEQAAPKEPDADVELELARAKRQSLNLQDELRQAKEQLRKLSEGATGLEALRASVKEDPVAALNKFEQVFGRNFGDFTRWIVENKAKVENGRKYADLPPEVREELEQSKKFRAELERREREQKQQVASTTYTNNVQQWLTENADDYPIAASFPGAAEALVAQYGIGKVRPKDIELFEKALSKSHTATYSQERALMRLLDSDEKLAAAVQAALEKRTKQRRPAPAVASDRNGQPAKSHSAKSLSNSASPGEASSETAPGVDPRKKLLMDAMKRMRAQQTRSE